MRTICFLLGALAATAAGSAAGAGAQAHAYTKAQLAIMVLPRGSLGPEARRLDVAIGSGLTNNAAAADSTLDPKDTGKQLARAGRIVGYELAYDELSVASFRRGRGLLEIDSFLDLFKSAAAADAFIAKQVRDARRLRGKRVDFGVRLASSSTFPVRGVDRHAVGLRTKALLGRKPFYGTLVGFRVGPLVAAVTVTRADAKPMAASTERLARALAERIRLVQAGRLRTRPVTVPPIGKKGRPPPRGPQLAPMALSGNDLPKGVTVARQEYVDDRQATASYEREFDTSKARFGGSVLTLLESDVSLLRSTTEGAGSFYLIRSAYMSDGIKQDFAEAFSKGAGAKVRGVKIEQRKSLSAGDESMAIVVRYSIGASKVRIAFIHIRVGRAFGSLLVAGESSKFHFADVQPLAGKLAKRIGDRL